MAQHAAAALLLILAALSGCSPSDTPPRAGASESTGHSQDAAAPSGDPPTPAVARQTIQVRTAEELVEAIGPDRTVQLAPGEYVLTGLQQRRMKYVRWQKQFDGYDLVIRDCRNLTLEGLGEKKVRILVRPGYVYVLAFERVEGLRLVNLEMGHGPDPGTCTGGVVAVRDGRDVRIEDCHLFGCGMEGLTLTDCREFSFLRSSITGCSYGIMTIRGSERCLFGESTFRDNREYHGFVLDDSADIQFRGCTIEKNQLGSFGRPPLFAATSCSNVVIEGGSITGNTFPTLAEPAGVVTFKNVTIERNAEPTPD